MKILFAHDGSDCSWDAVKCARNAGLPEEAEAVVLTAAEGWIAPALGGDFLLSPPYAPILGNEYELFTLTLKQARQEAQRAADELKLAFPHWQVRAESDFGTPFEAIERKSSKWRPDLVVMGSHGRSAAGRLVFGSVSHSVLTRLHRNLRIARTSKRAGDSSPRILAAVDGSLESQNAFEAALSRDWPKSAVLRLVTVLDPKIVTAYADPRGPVRRWARPDDTDPKAWIERMHAGLKRRIQRKGFVAESMILSGDPKRALLNEAENWCADALFAGSRGLTAAKRIYLGSVSTALAMQAPCSVEVTHKPVRNSLRRIPEATFHSGVKIHVQNSDCS